jgi:hypothetical protein
MILDQQLHDALIKPLRSSYIRVLALIDTCHSGTLLNLPVYTTNFLDRVSIVGRPELKETCASPIVSISACSDAQTSEDDVSSEFGFGGGLISAFLDAWKMGITIADLFAIISKRLTLLGQTSILSSDDTQLLGLGN